MLIPESGARAVRKARELEGRIANYGGSQCAQRPPLVFRFDC